MADLSESSEEAHSNTIDLLSIEIRGRLPFSRVFRRILKEERFRRRNRTTVPTTDSVFLVSPHECTERWKKIGREWFHTNEGGRDGRPTLRVCFLTGKDSRSLYSSYMR